MSKEVKSNIYQLADSIKDENILKMGMQNATNYASDKNATEELTKVQLKEMDQAIYEADNNATMEWKDFKTEINELKKQ